MTGLPRFVAFKSPSTGKFLSSDPHGSLTFSGTSIMTSFTRFELQLASSQTPQETNLFNIRSRYNNKYWTKELNGDDITCGADQPDTDPPKMPSTLFMVELDKFGHPKLVNILQYCDANTVVELTSYRSEIIDLDQLVVLPRFVAFKGDNDHFLRMETRHGYNHLVFTGTGTADTSVGCEIVPVDSDSMAADKILSDGTIRIRSIQNGKFWYSSPPNGYILGYDKEYQPHHKHSLYQAKRLENDAIALYNFGKDKFCKRYSTSYVQNSFCANVSDIPEFAKLKVVEFVRSREIYNIRFHEDDARVYNKQKMVMASEQIVNNNVDPMTTKLTLQLEKKRVSSWNSSVTQKYGRTNAKISVDSPIVPVTEFKVSVDSHYEWGESKETSERLIFEEEVMLQPNSKAVVSVTGTRAGIDIPFTYSQSDVLMDGEVKIYDNIQDGVYTCADTFTVETVINVESLVKEDKPWWGQPNNVNARYVCIILGILIGILIKSV